MSSCKKYDSCAWLYYGIPILVILFVNAAVGTALYHCFLCQFLVFYQMQIAMLVMLVLGLIGFLVYTLNWAEGDIDWGYDMDDYFMAFLTALGFEAAPFAVGAAVVGIVTLACLAVVLFFAMLLIGLLFGNA